MIKLSISVMAHPSREKYFGYLKEKLNNPKFSIDTESKGLLWNCVNSWKMHDLDSDYHLVVQDDAIICKDFVNKASEMIEKNGRYLYSFYHANRESWNDAVNDALKGSGYLIKKHVHSGLAIAIPRDLIPSMLDFFEKQKEPADDVRIGMWAKSIGLLNFIPIPSLIDHRDEKSLHNNNKGGLYRKAHKFIDNI